MWLLHSSGTANTAEEAARKDVNLPRDSLRNLALPRQRTDKAAECLRGHLWCSLRSYGYENHRLMKTISYLWTGDWERKQGLP